MSTLDVVAYAGEEFGGVKPANFLDIGGGASAQVMADGLDIILSDPEVKAVFVNVFGGITACDAVAERHRAGAADARATRASPSPSRSSCRLDGNNADRGPPDPRRGRARPSSSWSTPWTAPRAALAAARAAAKWGVTRWRSSSTENSQDPRPGHHRLRGHQAHDAACWPSARNIVAGVTPGKGGQSDVEADIPVFDTVAEAVAATGADVSVVFVPPQFAKAAVVEAVDAACRSSS